MNNPLAVVSFDAWQHKPLFSETFGMALGLPASHSMEARYFSLVDRVAGAWNWPLTTM